MKPIFEYLDYKKYITDALAERGHGSRKRFAEFVGFQSAYVAQVLNGTAHLSLEQCEEANDFFLHKELEAKYFLIILLYSRAGTVKLKKRYRLEADEIRKSSKQYKNRIDGVKKIRSEDMQKYFSSWLYLATHALFSIDDFNDAKSVAQRLGVETLLIEQIAAYLLQVEMIELKKGKIVSKSAPMHLPGDSPLVVQHHTNWRLQALRSIESFQQDNVHFSSIFAVSEEGREEIRETLIATSNKIRKIVQKSDSDDYIMSFCNDFFEL